MGEGGGGRVVGRGWRGGGGGWEAEGGLRLPLRHRAVLCVQ